MKIGNIIAFTALASLLGGCVVAPHPYGEPVAYQGYAYPGDYYDDYYGTPAYGGYYYVRVIFIGAIPYYVYDDLHIRPIPPSYRSHFSHAGFMERNRTLPPPRFRRDSEMRDGYDTGRVVYMNDVPYVVGNDRVAKPLPSQLRPNFRYSPPPAPVRNRLPMQNNNAPTNMREREQNMAPAYGREREQNMAPSYGREREQNMAPSYGREREQNMAPAYGREREQNMAPSYGREREQNMAPAYGREREQNMAPSYGREREQNMAPSYGRERQRSVPPSHGRERQQNVPPAHGREQQQNMPPAYDSEREQRMPPDPGSERERNGPPLANDAPLLMNERNQPRQQRMAPAPHRKEQTVQAREKARDKRKGDDRDKKNAPNDDARNKQRSGG